MNRIDVHNHVIPPFYRDALAAAGIADAGGRALPEWSAAAALTTMDLLGTARAILSVSTPGTGFVSDAAWSRAPTEWSCWSTPPVPISAAPARTPCGAR